MAEFTCLPPNKELHVEQTINERHIKKEVTGGTRWQQDKEESVLCQETHSDDQETYDFFGSTQPTGHPWNKTYSSLEQTTDTGRQQDEEWDVPIDGTCGLRAEMGASNNEFSTGKLSAEHHGKEMDCTEQPGKESASRETQTTDMCMDQETCDVNFPQPNNTSTSQVQESRGNMGRRVVNYRGEKPYKCGECGYKTSKKDHLSRHIRTHTGEKPYKCGECGFRTARKSILSTHIRTHTGEKPYKCDQCDYSAARKGELNKHLAKHSGEKPYMCEKCGYRTADTSHLSRHMRTHTGEKPYKCDQCEYSAVEKSKLDLHKRKHTGEKPYKCDQCNYSAAEKCKLGRHSLVHKKAQ
ncbi:zinc finger protein 37-like [Branchiostoma floridae]|uniref:Zinc finger protein 37-like n=1 Tax=Branchiostoma floridae TaxID=7739 RepID=A0A9J7MP82_BRAFL|nr:zinc finger protein 37-like [Branchiostoma floridae]